MAPIRNNTQPFFTGKQTTCDSTSIKNSRNKNKEILSFYGNIRKIEGNKKKRIFEFDENDNKVETNAYTKRKKKKQSSSNNNNNKS